MFTCRRKTVSTGAANGITLFPKTTLLRLTNEAPSTRVRTARAKGTQEVQLQQTWRERVSLNPRLPLKMWSKKMTLWVANQKKVTVSTCQPKFIFTLLKVNKNVWFTSDIPDFVSGWIQSKWYHKWRFLAGPSKIFPRSKLA